MDTKKRVVLDFFRALNQSEKKADVFPAFTTDQQLTEQLLYLETIFPHYQILVDEVTAEEQRVIVKARIVGRQKRAIPQQAVEIPFAMGYYISRKKIIDHWMITDTQFFHQKT